MQRLWSCSQLTSKPFWTPTNPSIRSALGQPSIVFISSVAYRSSAISFCGTHAIQLDYFSRQISCSRSRRWFFLKRKCSSWVCQCQATSSLARLASFVSACVTQLVPSFRLSGGSVYAQSSINQCVVGYADFLASGRNSIIFAGCDCGSVVTFGRNCFGT
jgi:hypothetical protein